MNEEQDTVSHRKINVTQGFSQADSQALPAFSYTTQIFTTQTVTNK